jgi:hypothetical protein
MAAKKTPRSKGNIKSAPRRSSNKFPCPNRGEPLTLKELIARMESDPAFAKFIAGLLAAPCDDDDAKDCLASYYSPTHKELTALGLSEGNQKKMRMICTVSSDNTTNFLIVVPANRSSKGK